jgi:hypothetical protein
MAALTAITTFLSLLIKHPKNTIIVVLILVIVLMRIMQPDPPICPECPEITHTTDTITYRDTIYVPVIEKKYVPKYVKVVRFDTIRTEVDTIEILKDYFASTIYSDTILNDTNGLITIHDEITENKIKSRSVKKKLYPHYTNTTIKVPETKRIKMYAGIGLNGWSNKFGASANVMIQNKRDHVYSVGYDPFNESVEFRVYWKIRLKK